MYKTILVHVDDSARSIQRVQVAAKLAVRFESHLVGAAMTGLPAYMFPVGSIDAGMPPVVFPIEDLRAEAERALNQFDLTANAEGVHSCERRVVDDEAGIGMCLQARYSDLTVIGQSVPNETMPRLRSDFPAYVLLNSPHPVLVLPHRGVTADIGRFVTVAWNGSAEAVRAITSALPLLKRAQRVDLVVINPAEGAEHGEEPGADMALFLARHGIRVELSVVDADAGTGAGETLLSFAGDKDADLIVMGAFGHSRLREYFLGGMTLTAIEASPVALWMSH